MTAAHDYEEVHRLVDRMSPAQVRRLRLLVTEDPELTPVAPPTQPADHPGEQPRRRSLGFIGTLDAEPDLAEQSAQSVRKGLGGE
ncbi:hypothetical protein ACQP0C_06610 [Nocardia sp. CA-129566]|uniref:hypothetical protein n=1 Tax=Nocardia sp. CA-129566 TaxID=3239976 RepID=UPI003D9572B2